MRSFRRRAGADGAEANAIAAAGLAPNGGRESALERQLAPGVYTAVTRGADRAAGITLLEVYDVSPATSSKLANVSTRSFTSTSDNVLIGGFIAKGGFPKRILLRALGGSLRSFGVADALADPTIGLYNANGAPMETNDNWQQASNSAEVQATGLAPSQPAEAAILTPLVAGSYTAIVRGANNSSGTALFEAYQLD